jgi:hypothetical protein
MKSLGRRIERLETEQAPFQREFSDAELAIRIAWMINQGGAMAERVYEFQAAMDAKHSKQKAPLISPRLAP